MPWDDSTDYVGPPPKLWLLALVKNDPLRRASEAIAGRIAATLDGTPRAAVVPLRRYG